MCRALLNRMSRRFTPYSKSIWQMAVRLSGSVGMGSMGSWEPVIFLTMGSGTHQFWKENTKIYPLFSSYQVRDWGWEFGTLN